MCQITAPKEETVRRLGSPFLLLFICLFVFSGISAHGSARSAYGSFAYTQCCPDRKAGWEEATQLPLLDPAAPSVFSYASDTFGYTWEAEPFAWIDATVGTNSGLTGQSTSLGPVDIGFDFKFYERAYRQLYLNTNGLLTFDSGTSAWDTYERQIPSRGSPNNLIAAHWQLYRVDPSGSPPGTVYYLKGGAAPNRYFVVEWSNVRVGWSLDPSPETFEVILHENGDIVVQWLDTWTDGTVGIEDSTGTSGLEGGLSDGTAVRFRRPAPAARITAWPSYQGSFVRPGGSTQFRQVIFNSGDLGADCYDLSASSVWPVSFYDANGGTPLTDTDGDGQVDTGALGEGSTITITIHVDTPSGAVLGDANTATVTMRSSVDAAKSKDAMLQAGVPAPFAQIYTDRSGAASLYLALPNKQEIRRLTTPEQSASFPAIARLHDGGFVATWPGTRTLPGSVWVSEIQYLLINDYGQIIRPLTKLTDHSGSSVSMNDRRPVADVAPNRRVGFVWCRNEQDSSWQTRSNVWFAALEPAGNLVAGPLNVTGIADWGGAEFLYPHIAATGDNRFVLAWWQRSGDIQDIYFAVRDSNGGEVKEVTKLTDAGTSWNEGYCDPNVAGLSNNRALLTWTRNGDRSLYYAVLDSTGNVLRNPAGLGFGSLSDTAQLSDGRTVVSWTGGSVYFAVLDEALAVVAGPTALYNPVAEAPPNQVSVAPAGTRAVLTWVDFNPSYMPHVYYALVDSAGGVVTPPMIFHSDPASNPLISVSWQGCGNTWYSEPPEPTPTPTPRARLYLPVVLKRS